MGVSNANTRRLLCLLVIATGWVALVTESTALAAAPPSFQGLGDLPGGTNVSIGNALSISGAVVVGTAQSAQGAEAFQWTQGGGITGLGFLPGGAFARSLAKGVSGDGSIVVGRSTSALGDNEAYRWTSAGGMVGLGDLPGGLSASQARAISTDGTVIVGSSQSLFGSEAFRWTQAQGMVGLGDLPGGVIASVAHAVSADGSVMAGFGNSDLGQEAAIWMNNTIIGLGDLPGGIFDSLAFAISSDGSTVAGFGDSASGTEAFVWRSGVMTGLGDLPGGMFISKSVAMSSVGPVVVGVADTDLGSEAFIWQDGVMRNLQDVLANDLGLDLTGWRLESARAISADGTIIAGVGFNPSGDREAWLATLPPPIPCVTGDLTDDLVVDLSDVAPFVAVLLDPPAATTAQRCAADLNQDTFVDARDIEPLLLKLLAQ